MIFPRRLSVLVGSISAKNNSIISRKYRLISCHFQKIFQLQPSFIKMGSKSKSALVVIAHGSEEIEAVTPIDVLRRAGVEVTVCGLLDGNSQLCSRQVILGVDKSLGDVKGQEFDAVLLPGGAKGAEAFVQSAELGEFLRGQDKAGRIVAAICAAPTAFKAHGIGLGKSLTSYPSFKEKVEDKYDYKEDRVVVDGNMITSRGPGTALEWSLKLVEILVSKEKADEIAKAMLVQ